MVNRGSISSATPQRRFAQWRDIICRQLIGVDMEAADVAGFIGGFASAPIGTTSLAEVSATPMWVCRRDGFISREAEPAFLVNVMAEGRAFAIQGANQFFVEQGDIFIQNANQPYTMEINSNFRILTLRVPAKLMANYMIPVDSICSVPLSLAGKTASIASSILLSLHENVDEISSNDAELAVGSALMMIGAAAAQLTAPPRTASHASFGRIIQFIDRNLRCPDLNSALVADAAGITVRQLNRIFENEHETVSRLILRRRLERCRLDLLSQGLASRTIGEVAYYWGFNNLSHFSESFRQAYGASPRETRRARFEQPASPKGRA